MCLDCFLPWESLDRKIVARCLVRKSHGMPTVNIDRLVLGAELEAHE